MVDETAMDIYSPSMCLLLVRCDMWRPLSHDAHGQH